jgi:NAD(P)H-hydrate epimerase
LVSIAAVEGAVPLFAGDQPGVIVRRADTAADLAGLLEDRRFNALLVGPGCEPGQATKDLVATVLRAGRAAVVDADGLTAYAGDAAGFAAAVAGPTVITPHEGEFGRLFPDLAIGSGGKIERARTAAKRLGAVVVLKGADSVIAHADGRVALNADAPATLATAGTGDVLAGMIVGLLAQGATPYDAACAGVWLHGAAAGLGPGFGLIAEDIPDAIPAAWACAYGTV